jgi:outer membrane phospholipase A
MVKKYKACIFLGLLDALCNLSVTSAKTNSVTNTDKKPQRSFLSVINTNQMQPGQNKKGFFFHIMPYEVNYILPCYYNFRPDEDIYRGNIPYNQQLKRYEVKFQISLAMPFWQNILGYPVTLYGAYTQLSFWQAYVGSAWFRETNYTPRIFLSYKVNRTLFDAWRLEYINIGILSDLGIVFMQK